MPDELDD
jgi:bifunctional DNase/RNase